MNYLWTPLFLLFAFLEYGKMNLCGSSHVVGQMWFMWLMMGIASSKVYIDLIGKKINGNS